MDFRTRPSKNTKLPPPLYLSLTGQNLIYCHTCGRVITPRRSHTSGSKSTPVKYCSDRCRHNKPGAIDRQIEDAFVALLEGDELKYVEKYGVTNMPSSNSNLGTKAKQPRKRERKKGEHRVIVYCSDIQALVFGHRFDQCAQIGEKKDSLRTEVNNDDRQSVFFENRYDPSLETNKTLKFLSETVKSEQGRKQAEEREMVRRAARRGVVFGFALKVMSKTRQGEGERHVKVKRDNKRSDKSVEKELTQGEYEEVMRKCEAVMTPAAIVVEPSFAKGDWAIRWREG